jgi:hypothetical protein
MELQITSFLSSELDGGVVNFTSWSPLLPYPLDATLPQYESQRNLFPLMGNRTRFLASPASSLATVANEQSRIRDCFN